MTGMSTTTKKKETCWIDNSIEFTRIPFSIHSNF